MQYAVIKDGVITNILVLKKPEDAAKFGAIEVDDSYGIGDTYYPEDVETQILETMLDHELRISAMELGI